MTWFIRRHHRSFWKPASSAVALMLLLICAQPAAADFGTGMRAYHKGDFQTAYKEWLRLAKVGDAEAQYWVGKLHADGKGIKKDDNVALSFFLKAAHQGHGQAQYEAATLLDPVGVGENQQDATLAFGLYMRAAVNGVTPAYTRLSIAYCFGDGVDENPMIADIWMVLSLEPFADRLDVIKGEFCDIFGKNDEAYLREVNRRAALLKEAYGLVSVPPPD